MTSLNPAQIASLLEKDKRDNLTVRERYPIPEQKGPIKYVDNTLRCVKRRCSSATYTTFKGIPYCTPHLIEEVNKEFNDG